MLALPKHSISVGKTRSSPPSPSPPPPLPPPASSFSSSEIVIEITADSHAAVRNNAEISYLLYSVSPMETFF